MYSMVKETLKPQKKRTEVISVYLSSEECEKFNEIAKQNHLTISSFIRNKILEKKEVLAQ